MAGPGEMPTEEDVDQELVDLFRAAIKVARAAPAKQGQYVTGAKVYWPYIHELRRALEACDIDWSA